MSLVSNPMRLRTLLVRVTVQTAVFLGVLGGLLFGAARSVDYWQGWTLLSVVALAVIAIDVWLLARDRALLERRLKSGSEGEPTARQKTLQALAGLAFFAMFVVSGIDHRSSWSHVPASIAIVGDALVLLGFAIVLLVFRANTFTSSVVEVESEQHVVTTGPYGVVRHPMYSGGLLLIAGIPVALGSWWALSLVVVLAAAIVARLLDEERMLERDLKGYGDYMQTTRYRLVPGVW